MTENDEQDLATPPGTVLVVIAFLLFCMGVSAVWWLWIKLFG